MRFLLALAPLALIATPAPAQADASVITHGWGYTTEEDGDYTSRGFCDATSNGGVTVSTTITCKLINTVNPNEGSTTVTGSSPTTAAATVEADTTGRGRLCLHVTVQYVNGTFGYYPGPTPSDMECTLL